MPSRRGWMAALRPLKPSRESALFNFMNPNLTPSGPMTRRHLIRQVFAYSAAAALGSRVRAFSAPSPGEEGMHFLMLGDFGNSKKYRIVKEGATPNPNDGDPNAPSMQTQVAA